MAKSNPNRLVMLKKKSLYGPFFQPIGGGQFIHSSQGAICPFGSTLNENQINVCFCEPPSIRGEIPDYTSGVTFTVNGSSLTHTLSNPVINDKCITYDVSPEINSGDIIIWEVDGSWDIPNEVTTINIINLIPSSSFSLDFSSNFNSGYIGVI